MSSTEVMQTLRRTTLVVPASSERKIVKAQAIDVDEVVIDLEDALAAEAKTNAVRALVAGKLRERWAAGICAVRVNAVGSPWFLDDLEQVVPHAGASLHAIVVPKVESAAAVLAVERLLERLEPKGHRVAIEAQIESARGLLHVEEIAAASDRLEALIFGPADFAASMGIRHLHVGGIDHAYAGDQWAYPRSRIAVAAHAHGLAAVDGPYGLYNDDDGLRTSAERARAVGLTGKWAIHPKQLDVCGDVFTPSAEERAHAKELLAALDGAAKAGEGATSLGSSMLDAASRRLALNILDQTGEGSADTPSR